MKPNKLEASRVNELARTASVDARTILRWAEGLPLKKMTLERIKAALVALGIVLALLVAGCGTIAIEEPADAGADTQALPPDTAPQPGACRAWGCVVGQFPDGNYGCLARPCVDPPEPVGEITFPDAGAMPN